MEKYNTLEFYNKNAKMYFEQTIEASIEENYTKFLSRIPINSYILDFGCGSGRDSKYFLEKGYKVKAIDGSSEMCKLASSYIGQNVECMKFDELSDENIYDGIWACSSILHVEKEDLPHVLKKMIKALKKNGIIYTAFKKGKGYEIKEGKYYNFLTKEELEDILREINKTSNEKAELIDYFETLPSTKRKGTITWANYIIKKLSIGEEQ